MKLVNFNYDYIIDQFATLIYYNCHNLFLYNTIQTLVKTSSTVEYQLITKETYSNYKHCKDNRSGYPTYKLQLENNGISQSNYTKNKIIQHIKKQFNINNFSSKVPSSEEIIKFLSWILKYCQSYLYIYRQVYYDPNINLKPATYLIYDPNITTYINYSELTIEKDVIHATQEITDNNINKALSIKQDGMYKSIFEKIKNTLNIKDIEYSWYAFRSLAADESIPSDSLKEYSVNITTINCSSSQANGIYSENTTLTFTISARSGFGFTSEANVYAKMENFDVPDDFPHKLLYSYSTITKDDQTYATQVSFNLALVGNLTIIARASAIISKETKK